VAINCAAIPENLLESELFGYERGAFTGATTSKAGRFEQAEGGTLVLDEIGELPFALQGKLLRAIQERVVDRLGGAKPITIDVRIIALTNRDLAQEVTEGRFREDLYYRLNVIPLRLPPLRERKGDLHLLAAHFAERYSRENDRSTPSLSPGFFAALEMHPWPGNIRELENTMQRCIVLHSGTCLVAQDLEWLIGAEAINAIPKDTTDTVYKPYLPETTAIKAINEPMAIPHSFISEAVATDFPAPTKSFGTGASNIAPIATEPLVHQMTDPSVPLVNAMLDTPVTLPLGLPLPDLERFWLLSTLAAVGGNRTHCAQQLNIALRTVRNKINEYKEQGYTIPSSRLDRDN
jgi:DNA-binding NtrC family response regulator